VKERARGGAPGSWLRVEANTEHRGEEGL